MSTQLSSAPNGGPLINNTNNSNPSNTNKKRNNFFSKLNPSNIININKSKRSSNRNPQPSSSSSNNSLTAIPNQNHQHQHQHHQQRIRQSNGTEDGNASSIERCLDWLLHSDKNLEDWVQVFEFCDRLKMNEADCLECVSVLRKSIKRSNASNFQARAIRLAVILALNSSRFFRLQIGSKKFLEVLEELYLKSNRSSNLSLPQFVIVRNMIIRALSVLAHEFQNDKDLKVFADLYNRIKPADAPLNGYPLSESDALFTPASATTAHPSNPTNQPNQYPVQLPNSQPLQAIPAMRDIRAEAEIARSNARLLIEALAFTTPSEMESNEIISEFHSKCLQSQNQLMDDIPWATSQAENSRLNVGSGQAHQPNLNSTYAPPPLPPRTNPYQDYRGGGGGGGGGRSREEELLETLLSANSELVDAFKQFDELERLARNEKEMREVEEISKRETSNRTGSGGGVGGRSGSPQSYLGENSSGSSSGSLPVPIQGGMSMEAETSGSSGSGSSSSSSNVGSNVRLVKVSQTQGYQVEEEGEGYGSEEKTISFKPTITSTTTIHGNRPSSSKDDEKDEDEIVTPVVPSEKALGKMRRISGSLGPNGLSTVGNQNLSGIIDSSSSKSELQQQNRVKNGNGIREDFDVRGI